MKKFIIAVCAMLFCTLGVQAQSKIGHIDRAGLMKMHPGRPAAEAKMQEEQKKKEAQLKAMHDEYNAAVAAAQALPETTPKSQQQATLEEIQKLEVRIQEATEAAKQYLANLEEELLTPMLADAEKAIKDVAVEGKFNYILDTSIGFVLYYDAGIDIMPDVKKKMNIP